MENLMAWVADLLEMLDDHLREKLGPDWWLETPPEKAVPRRWRK
jgi:hypothetical protein